jgi:hypothetical protein
MPATAKEVSRRLTVTEVARMARADLRRAFPAVKFRVYQGSGGGSLNVVWTDGPTGREVDAIAGQYQGAGFDGSIDLAYSVDAWVLDGEIIGHRTTGTADSRGSVPAYGIIPPHDDAELWTLPRVYVWTRRRASVARLAEQIARLAHAWRMDAPAIAEWHDSGAYVDPTREQDLQCWNRTHRYWAELLQWDTEQSGNA